tara:strand:- start:45 stop:1043 length:999 start_codon:yes stop_codon:yes gene_type:complete
MKNVFRSFPEFCPGFPTTKSLVISFCCCSFLILPSYSEAEGEKQSTEVAESQSAAENANTESADPDDHENKTEEDLATTVSNQSDVSVSHGRHADSPPIGPSSTGLLAIIFSLTLISILSLAMTFWLYRWRRKFTDKYEIVVPEDWRATSDRHEKGLQFQDQRISELTKHIGILAEQGVALQKMIESMTSTYMGLQGSLDDKDAELARFKKGYDSTIYRNFLKRFIRVDLVLQSHLDDGEIDIRSLEQIRELSEDALDECGLEVFHPEINADYGKTDGVEDYPKTVPTDDPDLIGKIIEVRQPGYRLQETGEVVQKAKVTVYSEPAQDKEAY